MTWVNHHMKKSQPFNPRTILHRAAAPAARPAVKTEVSYQKDTIIAIFFSPNKNKDNAEVPLDSLIVNLRIPGLICIGNRSVRETIRD